MNSAPCRVRRYHGRRYGGAGVAGPADSARRSTCRGHAGRPASPGTVPGCGLGDRPQFLLVGATLRFADSVSNSSWACCWTSSRPISPSKLLRRQRFGVGVNVTYCSVTIAQLLTAEKGYSLLLVSQFGSCILRLPLFTVQVSFCVIPT